MTDNEESFMTSTNLSARKLERYEKLLFSFQHIENYVGDSIKDYRKEYSNHIIRLSMCYLLIYNGGTSLKHRVNTYSSITKYNMKSLKKFIRSKKNKNILEFITVIFGLRTACLSLQLKIYL
jgi:hypothetical protein